MNIVKKGTVHLISISLNIFKNRDTSHVCTCKLFPIHIS